MVSHEEEGYFTIERYNECLFFICVNEQLLPEKFSVLSNGVWAVIN
jgi:hypothetical protein